MNTVSNVICLLPDEEQRKPFSFDMTQIDARGMVLIDACVPFAMATAFLEMLIAFESRLV